MRADEQGTQPEVTLPAIRCGVATAYVATSQHNAYGQARPVSARN